MGKVGPVFRDGWDLGYAANLSPNGKWIAYGCQTGGRGNLLLLDVATGQVIRQLDNLSTNVHVIAFSPDSRVLAWAGEATIHLLEMATGNGRHFLTGHRGCVLTLCFSADGKTLVSGSSDTTALVWDLTGRLRNEGAWGKPLPRTRLDACWTALASEDAAIAYQAVRKLAASPTQTIPYLRERLRPAGPLDEKRLASLIADLDNPLFAIREKAVKDLEQLGELAIPACRKALEGKPSLDVCRRLECLIEKQSQQWHNPTGHNLRTVRIVEVLEQAGTQQAQHLLQDLAQGTPEAILDARIESGLGAADHAAALHCLKVRRSKAMCVFTLLHMGPEEEEEQPNPQQIWARGNRKLARRAHHSRGEHASRSGLVPGSDQFRYRVQSRVCRGGRFQPRRHLVPGSAFPWEGSIMRQLLCGLVALGVIVGGAEEAEAQYAFTTIDVPGATSTVGNGINDAGQIVGTYDNQHGFLFSNGSYTTVDVAGVQFTQASGINASGQIVGYYGGPTFSGQLNGFLLSGGVYTTLGVPGSTLTAAFGINASGQIVGTYSAPSGGGSFLLTNGNYTTLNSIPGSFFTSAVGINDASQIVGQYRAADGTLHGFLLQNGSFTTVDPPGSTATSTMALTTLARSWDLTAPTDSFLVMVSTPCSTCLARSRLLLMGSTTLARFLEPMRLLTAPYTASSPLPFPNPPPSCCSASARSA